MADLITLENLTNLIMLCFLQAVLGFDNLLYISIESKRAPVASQKAVRMWGILIAVALRVVLLFVMIRLIDLMKEPLFMLNWEGILEGGVNFATIVFVIGGIFIMYTAVKEIGHMLSMDNLDHDVSGKGAKSAVQVVLLIVIMNLIFSFDSVLSALAITDVFPILAFAIILSGVARHHPDVKVDVLLLCRRSCCGRDHPVRLQPQTECRAQSIAKALAIGAKAS